MVYKAPEMSMYHNQDLPEDEPQLNCMEQSVLRPEDFQVNSAVNTDLMEAEQLSIQ